MYGALSHTRACACCLQIKFLFDTIVTLSMDAGITHGSTTSLRLATLTSEFIVDVLFFERRDYVFEG